MALNNFTDPHLYFHTREINWLFPVSLTASIISILMHSMILHAVFKRCDWLNTRYYILTSLAIADFMIAILPVFFLPALHTSSSFTTLQKLSTVVDFILNFGMTSSLSHVMLLSLHRYFYCLSPFLSARLLTKNKVVAAICGSWILAATLSISNSFSKAKHLTGDQLILLRLFAVIQYSIAVALSMIVVIFVQCRLLISTLEKLNNEQLQRRVVARQNLNRNRNTKRRLIPMIVIILIHICFFAPFPIALTLLTFGYDGRHQQTLHNIINLMPFLCSFINQIVYGLQIYEVRRGIKKDLREMKRYIIGGRLNQIEADINTTTRKTSRLVSFSCRARINATGMPQLSEKIDDNNNKKD